MGMRWFPLVGWAERGGGHADGHGNSIPRFHITWGTGTGVVEPYADRITSHPNITLHFRRRVTSLLVEGGVVKGVEGDILADDEAARGQSTTRDVTGQFSLQSETTAITTGGIGGNHDLVRKVWPTERLGPAPKNMISGVPHHVDGLMQAVAARAGANLINGDRMWHYVEGVKNWDPIWPKHAIRITRAQAFR